MSSPTRWCSTGDSSSVRPSARNSSGNWSWEHARRISREQTFLWSRWTGNRPSSFVGSWRKNIESKAKCPKVGNGVCLRNRSGNMPRGLARLALATGNWIWSLGIRRIQALPLIRSVKSRPTRGDFMTWLGMFGSGAQTGTCRPIRLGLLPIQKVQLTEQLECFEEAHISRIGTINWSPLTGVELPQKLEPRTSAFDPCSTRFVLLDERVSWGIQLLYIAWAMMTTFLLSETPQWTSYGVHTWCPARSMGGWLEQGRGCTRGVPLLVGEAIARFSIWPVLPARLVTRPMVVPSVKRRNRGLAQ